MEYVSYINRWDVFFLIHEFLKKVCLVFVGGPQMYGLTHLPFRKVMGLWLPNLWVTPNGFSAPAQYKVYEKMMVKIQNNQCLLHQNCRFKSKVVPYYTFSETKSRHRWYNPLDLNISFQGLAAWFFGPNLQLCQMGEDFVGLTFSKHRTVAERPVAKSKWQVTWMSDRSSRMTFRQCELWWLKDWTDNVIPDPLKKCMEPIGVSGKHQKKTTAFLKSNSLTQRSNGFLRKTLFGKSPPTFIDSLLARSFTIFEGKGVSSSKKEPPSLKGRIAPMVHIGCGPLPVRRWPPGWHYIFLQTCIIHHCYWEGAMPKVYKYVEWKVWNLRRHCGTHRKFKDGVLLWRGETGRGGESGPGEFFFIKIGGVFVMFQGSISSRQLWISQSFVEKRQGIVRTNCTTRRWN